MSRTTETTQTGVKNPATCYLTWSGEKGVFNYWDGEKRVEVPDLSFAVIERTKAVTGWDNGTNSRIYSNNVLSTKHHMVVRESKTGSVLAEGDYSEIKSDRWKYEENIIAAAEIDGMVGIIQISLSGASLQSFMEFCEENSKNRRFLYDNLITIKRSDLQKKGRVEYYQPIFELSELDEKMGEQADEFDKTLVTPYIQSLIDRQESFEANSQTVPASA